MAPAASAITRSILESKAMSVSRSLVISAATRMPSSIFWKWQSGVALPDQLWMLGAKQRRKWPNKRLRELPNKIVQGQRGTARLYCVCNRVKLTISKGKMQCPLETSVQRLRNTRYYFEEICAWTTVLPQSLCIA